MTDAATPPAGAPAAEPEYAWDYTPESTYEGAEPLVVTLIGEAGTGKTHTAMTFQRPLAIFDTEARARAVARKPGFRDVYIKNPKTWEDIKAGIMWLVKKGNPGTIMFDSGSDVRDMIESFVLRVYEKKGEKAHHRFHWGDVYEELKTMLAFLRSKGWFVIFTGRLGDVFVNDLKQDKRDASGFVRDKLVFYSDIVLELAKGKDGYVGATVRKNGSKRIGYYRTELSGDEINFNGIMKEWNAPEIPPLEKVASSSLKVPPAPPTSPTTTALSGAPAQATSAAPSQAPAPTISPASPPAPAAALSTPATPPASPPVTPPTTGAPHYANAEGVADMEVKAAKLGTSRDDLWSWLRSEGHADSEGRIPLMRFQGVMKSLEARLAEIDASWKINETQKGDFTGLGRAAGLTGEEMKAFPKVILGREVKGWNDIKLADYEKMVAALKDPEAIKAFRSKITAMLAAKAVADSTKTPSTPPPTPSPSTPPANAAPAAPPAAPAPAAASGAAGPPSAPPVPAAGPSTQAAPTDPELEAKWAYVDTLTNPEAFGIAKTIEKPESPITDAATLIGHARVWLKALVAGNAEAAKRAFAPLQGAGYLPIAGVALLDDVFAVEALFKRLGMSHELGWSKAVEKKLAVGPRKMSQAQARTLISSLGKAADEKAKIEAAKAKPQ